MSTDPDDGVGDFVRDDERVLHDVCFRGGSRPADLAFERAGARQHIFFDPAKTRAAVVTCGGLCPGLNNVIRTLFFELKVNYGIREVLGIRYGYRGLQPNAARAAGSAHARSVENIQHHGGTVLGTSRCPHDAGQSVDFLAAAERRHPVLRRRRRHAARRTCHRHGNRAAQAADRRRRHPQDDRQRHQVLRADVRLLYRRGGSGDRDRPGPHRGDAAFRTESAW